MVPAFGAAAAPAEGRVDPAHRLEELSLLRQVVDAARLLEEEPVAAAVEGVRVPEVLVGLVEDGLTGGPVLRVVGVDDLENVGGGVGGDGPLDGGDVARGGGGDAVVLAPGLLLFSDIVRFHAGLLTIVDLFDYSTQRS